MTQLRFVKWLPILAVFLMLVTSCTLSRSEDVPGDIDDFVPPPVTSPQPEVTVAPSEAILRVQPASQRLDVGLTTTVEIWLENVSNLAEVDIQLAFDSDVVQVIDADPNRDGAQIQPGTFLPPANLILAQAENVIGLVQYIFGQPVEAQPIRGSGIVATITFEAVQAGSSELVFEVARLVDNQGQLISVTPQSGLIIANPVPEDAGGQPTQVPAPVEQPTAQPTPIPDDKSPVQPTPLTTVAPVVPTPTTSPLAKLPAGATLGFCYRVQKKDTLAGIAAANGTTAHNIQVVNDLHPPFQIYIQQALFIPTQMGSGPNFYLMQPDDTLDSIAAACNLPANFITWVNKKIDIVPGQIIQIPIPPFPPPSRFPHPPPGPPAVFPPPSYGAYPAPAPKHGYGGGGCDYVVQAGDTLFSIGRRYGLSVEALMNHNGLASPDYIYAGQCLKIPSGW
ncbi:MAG: LysM peptidoglycan-binding domain-containing protein [Anaerolineae bacterium]|nr:LysM peptidoglycan-binding domain-containing protein [Anaerolineae bacterium]